MVRSAPRQADDGTLADRAHALVRGGRYAEAAALYRELVNRYPGDPSLRLHLREACRRKRRHLVLVPPPYPDDDVIDPDDVLDDDEPLTDPYCPIFEWIGPAPPLRPRRYR